MDEQAKAEFDRLADAVERFQRILNAAGNAPRLEQNVLAELATAILPPIRNKDDAALLSEVVRELDDYLGIKDQP